MKSVLVVDDHPLYLQGLEKVLHQYDPGMQVTPSTTGADAIQQVKRGRWDLVVLDISLPDKNGLDVLKQIRTAQPNLPVLILSIHAEEQYALRVLKAGASGYLTKDSTEAEVKQAVQKIIEGGRVIGPKLTEKLQTNNPAQLEAPHETLSDREMQVLCMIASGKGVKEIGEELALSVKTVSTYRARILEKLGKSNNAELIQFAILHRLVPEIPASGRRFERYVMPATARVKHNSAEFEATIWNISLGGICVDSMHEMAEGEDVVLKLVGGEESETVEGQGRVIWRIGNRYGIAFSGFPEKSKKVIYRWTRALSRYD
ncbi:MAG TPA: response regulator [Bdellovibrionales bacterium]|nr:response regulator [Bdellovibrionales bacterium]